MLSERPLNQRESGSRSPFGETINVVQAVFFHRAKCGDRFWYEFPKAGFTVSEYSDVTLTCGRPLDMNTITIYTLCFIPNVSPTILFKDTLRATNDSTILRIYTMYQRG